MTRRRLAAVLLAGALAASCRHTPRVDPDGLKRWPADVPLYPHADVDFGITDVPDVGSAGLSTGDDLGRVLEFYRTSLPARGWTLVAVALPPTLPRPLLSARKDRRSVALTGWASAQAETGVALYVLTEPAPPPPVRSRLESEFPTDLPLFPGARCKDGMTAMMELRADREHVRAFYASELPCHGFDVVARGPDGTFLAMKERRTLRVSVGDKQSYTFVRLELDPAPGAPAEDGVARAWPDDVPLYGSGLEDFAYVVRLQVAATPQAIVDYYAQVLAARGWRTEPASRDIPSLHAEHGGTDILVMVEPDAAGGPAMVKITVAP